MQTYDAISDAEPQTLGGLAAKARATKAEATHPDGTVMPEDEVQWAFDLVEDLIRLDEQNFDAELLAACHEFLRINRAFEAACVALRGNLTNDHPAWDMLDPLPELTERIVALRAQTAEGFLARARCAAFYCLPQHSSCQDDPDAGREDRFTAAIMRDAVRLNRETPA